MTGRVDATTVVLDASALAALMFGEPDAPLVAERLCGRSLTAPTLLRYEVTSVFLKKWESYPSRRADLEGMLRAYPFLAIDEVQVDVAGTAALARRTRLTAYDAAYLWLADRLTLPLVTLDERLGAAARDLGLEAS